MAFTFSRLSSVGSHDLVAETFGIQGLMHINECVVNVTTQQFCYLLADFDTSPENIDR